MRQAESHSIEFLLLISRHLAAPRPWQLMRWTQKLVDARGSNAAVDQTRANARSMRTCRLQHGLIRIRLW
jgi:hypothetical protein